MRRGVSQKDNKTVKLKIGMHFAFHFRLPKKNAPQSEYQKIKLISKEYLIITNELFHLCSFCHKCQKPVFYTLCLLRHRSLLMLVLPASRFLVCVHFRSSNQRVDFIDTLKGGQMTAFLCVFMLLLCKCILQRVQPKST